MLVIIGGFVYWFGCSLLSFFQLLFNFFLIIFFYFNNCIFLNFFFFLFLLPFLLSRVADRILVLRLGVKPEPLRWQTRIQDIGPPETSQPHVTSNGKSSPRDLHLNTKTQLHSMTSKLQCWTPHAKQLARREHNPTH